MINHVNKGDSLRAEHTNQMVDGINANVANDGANTILTSGIGGFSISTTPQIKHNEINAYENAFHLGFEESVYGELKAYVLASFIVIDNKVIIPTLNDAPIAEEEPTEDFTPPKIALEDGEWEFWVELDKLEYTAKVHIEKAEDIDQSSSLNTTFTEWRKYGTFTIENNSLKSYAPYIKQAISEPLVNNFCWTPKFYRNPAGDWKFKISKGFVISVNNGAVTEVFEDEELEPVEDDIYYCKIDTDENGLITYATIEKSETLPENTQHDAQGATYGVYYYRLFQIKGDGEDLPYIGEQTYHSTIFFHSNRVKNVGDGVKLLTDFIPLTNTSNAKSLKAKYGGGSGGSGSGGSGFTSNWIDAETKITIEDKGETIEFGATTKIPAYETIELEICTPYGTQTRKFMVLP